MTQNSELTSFNGGSPDPKLFELIPHRPPMLLLHELVAVDSRQAQARVIIDADVPFYQADQAGVPAWIGLEYMGQTAALIGGYQRQQQSGEPMLGFLLGSRKYKCHVPYFECGMVLTVSCQEKTVVGESLANFTCKVECAASKRCLADAELTVFRRPVSEAIIEGT